MTLVLNKRLWSEARAAGSQAGVNLYSLAQIQRHTLSSVSRIWIENHGERVAGMVSALLKRPVKIEEIFPNWDRPDERPLTSRESSLLRRAVEARADDLTPREMGIVRLTFGLEGQPVSLARVAAGMGLTRERIRQIETEALWKLGVSLPARRDKSPVARRRRARLLLKTLNEDRRDTPRELAPTGGERARAGFRAGPRLPAEEYEAALQEELVS